MNNKLTLEVKYNWRKFIARQMTGKGLTTGMGDINYQAVLDNKRKLCELCKKTSLFSKIKKHILKKIITMSMHSIREMPYIKPNELHEFVKFYLATTPIMNIPNEYIKGTLTNTYHSNINDKEYFKLTILVEVVDGRDKSNKSSSVCIYTSPAIHDAYIGLDHSMTISKPGKQTHMTQSYTERLFLDTSEDYDYKIAWLRICDFIEDYMLDDNSI